MNKIILIVLVGTIISTGYFQEIGTIENGETQLWFQQGQQKKSKPCTQRRDNNDFEEPWIPSYSSRVIHHLTPDSFLQAQSLKNEDYVIEPNPDSNNENNGLIIPESRFLNSANQHISEDECFEEPTSTTRAPGSANEAAIKILKNCLKLKQKQLQISSRRSMSDPAPNDSNELLMSEENQQSEMRFKDTQINPRVCYACSTATNPSCWQPDKKTTVKYCTREKSCVTKTFGAKNTLTLIRDCADSCEDTSILGIEPKFSKCNICHSDLCNGAYTINPVNLIIIFAVCVVKSHIILS